MSVYFIEAVGTNRVKIGYAENPDERVLELQTGSPYPLRLLFSVPGDRAVESEYHTRYSHSRIDNSEWFYFDSKLRQLIDAATMISNERHNGLPVLRGILTNLTETWFPNHDGLTESPEAYIQVMCPECYRSHQHGWDLGDGFEILQHKYAHCDPQSAFRENGYYVGLIKQKGVHCHEPGRLITRPCRKRKRS